MLKFGCFPLTLTELGGDTAIIPSGKYLSIYDTNGNCKVLERPASRCVLVFDGTDIYFADGGDGAPIYLPSMTEIGGGVQHILAITNSGRVMRTVGQGEGLQFLTSLDGIIDWQMITTIGIPATGHGLLQRVAYDDPSAVPAPSFLNAEGLVFINSDGTAVSLPNGTNNQQLTLVNQIPVWSNPPSGSVSAGTAATGMSGIVASNTSASVVNVQAASMTLDDGTGTTYRASGINVSADLSAAVGLGGLDTGAESSNKWYYLYVVSDGALVDCIISENAVSPSFANAAGYSFYSLASVFRNDASGNIVKFVQRGRAFYTPYVVMSDPVSITTSFNPISQGVPMTSIVPPNVKTVSGAVGGSASANEGNNVLMFLSSDNIGLAQQVVPHIVNMSARDGFVQNYGTFFNMPILDPVSPVLYWKGNQGSTKRRIVINGYEI